MLSYLFSTCMMFFKHNISNNKRSNDRKEFPLISVYFVQFDILNKVNVHFGDQSLERFQECDNGQDYIGHVCSVQECGNIEEMKH